MENGRTFDLILVQAKNVFLIAHATFGGRRDFDPSRDNHDLKGASRVASMHIRRSAPTPTHMMVRALLNESLLLHAAVQRVR